MDNLSTGLNKQEEVKKLEEQHFTDSEVKNNFQVEQLTTDNKKLTAVAQNVGELENQSQNSIDQTSDKTNEQTTVAVATDGDDEHSAQIFGTISDLFKHAIQQAFPDDLSLPVLLIPSRQADYQCVSAMPITQKLNAAGKKTTSQEVAKIIVANIPQNSIIHKIGFSGRGFINIDISPTFVSEQIRKILLKGVLPPKVIHMVGNGDMTSKPKVVIDFSSPNIAKEMHVGHLRSTIIGDSLARLLEYVGFDVLRLNHLGDWGTQFGMLIAHLQDVYPEYRTKSPSISDLLALYKASKKRFDSDSEFKKRAYDCVVKLQSFDRDIVHAWQLICEVSRRDFEYIYQELDIRIQDRGESFYQTMMIDLVQELNEKNLLKTEEGRQVMFVPDIDVPMTIVKTDGGFTYDTSDMATIKQRLYDEKADWIIYVIDSGQSLHMQSIFAGAKLAGWLENKKTRIDHVGFGVVLGPDGKKFKTRSGDTIRLRDLLDEGVQRSMARLKEKNRDTVLTSEELTKAQKSVAYGCIKYADLSHNRNSDYTFDFDRMLDDRGNTAAYLLYAYTRIRSIVRTAGVDSTILNEKAHTIQLNFEENERELKLAKYIIKFPDVLTRVLDDLLMHSLCDFMYQLSKIFTEFYDNCYCVEKDQTTGEVRLNFKRLLLCEATANILKQCFNILGIQPLDRM